MTASRDYPRVPARRHSGRDLEGGATSCQCRCAWCRDRRYYLADHLAMPEAGPDPQPGHSGYPWPCRCHCPWCHHLEPHRVHFHLFHYNWDCPNKAHDWATSGMHSHDAACREMPWVASDGTTKQPASPSERLSRDT